MGPRKKRSKTPSGARSSSEKLLKRSTFFLDESILSADLYEALRAAGATVERAPDHFPRGTPDQIWLAFVGQRGWIALTKDTRIRYRKLEQEAFLRHGVRAFVFTGGKVRGEEMAQVLAGAALRMARLGASVKPPFIYGIGRAGKPTRLR
jgi:hypothetical protein